MTEFGIGKVQSTPIRQNNNVFVAKQVAPKEAINFSNSIGKSDYTKIEKSAVPTAEQNAAKVIDFAFSSFDKLGDEFAWAGKLA